MTRTVRIYINVPVNDRQRDYILNTLPTNEPLNTRIKILNMNRSVDGAYFDAEFYVVGGSGSLPDPGSDLEGYYTGLKSYIITFITESREQSETLIE